jgi:hypothetical protein
VSRYKTFDSSGIATAGRLYAGDLNAIQDRLADLVNYAQVLGAASVSVGDAGIALVKYGPAEARLTAALRTDGILRALGGLYAGSFATTDRNLISSPPYGLIILNITTNQYEWNKGTPSAPNWQPIGLASVGTGDISDGSVTSAKIADGTISTVDIADGAITSAKIADGTIVAGDIQDGTITYAKIAAGAVQKSPTSGTLAARPSTNLTAGMLYFATDQDVAYFYTGSAWIRVPGSAQAGDITMTLNSSAATGRILLQGQAWPSTTGIYADLFAKWGGSTLPDMQGRSPVGLGTHGDISTLRNNEGESVGNRRPKHHHTVTSNAVTTGTGTGAPGGSEGTTFPAATTTVGPTSGGASPTDSGGYYTIQFEAHL